MSDEMKTRLLVVDDEQSIRRLCIDDRNTAGICLRWARKERRQRWRDWHSDTPDLLLTDLNYRNMSGVELLKQTRVLLPHTEVAIMTGHGSIESAVDAMKLGVTTTSKSRFRVEKMRLLLQRMAEKVRLVTENESCANGLQRKRKPRRHHWQFREYPGRPAHDFPAERYTDAGTDLRGKRHGKELAARAIHFRGAIGKNAFRSSRLRLAGARRSWRASSSDTNEAHLRERRNRRPGSSRQRTEERSSWTRSGSCPWKCRRNYCACCRKKKCGRWASNEKISVDVRVIAATKSRSGDLLSRGTFRKDLYFRLNVVTVHLSSPEGAPVGHSRPCSSFP